jgi:hypothetical protein
VKTYIQIEAALEKSLTNALAKAQSALVKEIEPLLTEGKFSAAIAKVEAFSLEGTFPKKRVASLSAAAYNWGARKVSKSQSTTLVKASRYASSLEQIEVLYGSSAEWIRGHFSKSILNYESDTKKTDNLPAFVSFLRKRKGSPGFTSAQLTSSLHMSRMAQYGFTLEAKATDVQYYRLNTVEDSRRSKLCAALHGKEFPVAIAHEHLNRVLEVKDVNSLKTLDPFPDMSVSAIEGYKTASAEQLIEAGIFSPPFHPYCRTHMLPSRRVSTTSVQESLDNNNLALTGPSDSETLGALVNLTEAPASEQILSVISDVSVGADLLAGLGVGAVLASVLMSNQGANLESDLIDGVDDFELMDRYGISFQDIQLLRESLGL